MLSQFLLRNLVEFNTAFHLSAFILEEGIWFFALSHEMPFTVLLFNFAERSSTIESISSSCHYSLWFSRASMATTNFTSLKLAVSMYLFTPRHICFTAFINVHLFQVYKIIRASIIYKVNI